MFDLIGLLKSIPSSVLLFISICFVTFADYFGKKWSIDHKTYLLIIACLASLFSGLFYYPILLKQGLVISSLVWTIASILAFLIIGFVIFHETVTTLQIIGIIFGVVSVIILSI